MKAVLCRELGLPEALGIGDLPTPQPGPGEVLVDVKAAGVAFPDLLMIQNKYQIKPALPFTPGGELAGVVRSLGEGVTDIAIGDRVAGFMHFGAFAECAVIKAGVLAKIPEGVRFVEAAAVPLNYATVLHALRQRARLGPGETLLVLGASGGIGLASVELGKLLGARVIACASSEEKLASPRDYGADLTIDYEHADLRSEIKRLTDGEGVDVVLDPVGGRYAEPAVRGLGWEGRYLVVGFAAGEIPRIPLNLPLLKGASIIGVMVGGFRERQPEAFGSNFRDIYCWLSEGRIRPLVTQTYPLERAADALRDLAKRRVRGKAVLVTS